MHSKWSLEQKMTNLLVVFGVFPLCVMACIMLSLRWQTHVSEDIQHKQYILDNISADARMVASHTESVVRAFADSEALVDLLSARSNAEWSIQFRDGVYPEISKAEMYLSSLHANIMVIFDRDDISQEHWAILLDAERFANDESYQNFVQSGKYAGWYGVSSVMPESIAGVYDFRNMGEKFTYYCRVNTGVGRSLGVIKCAVDSRTFIDSALLRADNSAMYIFSGDSALYAADDQCDESMRAEFSVNDCIRADGSLWQHMRIADLDLDVILRTNVKTLFLEYVYASSGMLILIVAAIILLFSLARKVLVSLLTRFKRIALAADSINTKDGRVHLPEDGEDEVGHVVRAFNSLFDRLDKQMEENIGKEKAKRHMQALALQYQLNPHFLFNSLLWLQMKLEDQGVEKRISRSITRLGSVLRYNLSESLDSTLEQEAEHLKAYIDFMCEMKKQRITLEQQWDGELGGIAIPRFLLQPLIENALQHGLIRGEDMNVRVNVSRSGERIRFCISNDGRTIDEERLALLRQTFDHPSGGVRGVGISNLVQRLQLKYGNRYHISVFSRDRKTEFVIEIPADEEGDKP